MSEMTKKTNEVAKWPQIVAALAGKQIEIASEEFLAGALKRVPRGNKKHSLLKFAGLLQLP